MVWKQKGKKRLGLHTFSSLQSPWQSECNFSIFLSFGIVPHGWPPMIIRLLLPDHITAAAIKLWQRNSGLFEGGNTAALLFWHSVTGCYQKRQPQRGIISSWLWDEERNLEKPCFSAEGDLNVTAQQIKVLVLSDRGTRLSGYTHRIKLAEHMEEVNAYRWLILLLDYALLCGSCQHNSGC